MPARHGRKGLLVAALLVPGGLATYAYWSENTLHEAQPFPGMVRETEIRVAPEISGRLASFAVTPGQHVKRGDLLATIDNPDLTAALVEAVAASASALADRARVYSGPRPEEVAIAAQTVRTAEANLLLARQQNDRAETLNSESFLSKQQLDESRASLAKAQADLAGKRAQYAAAQTGPTAEERQLADARAAMSGAAVASIEAQLVKTRLLSPADGRVGIRVAEPGEIMLPGKSVLTVSLDREHWFAFTLREDKLDGLSIGVPIVLTTANGQAIEARLSELRPLGEFATWRAARAVGDHDLNSFRLRFDSEADTSGVYPGMTVWLPPR